MELELGIIREPVAGNPKERLRVFSESGGTIGRARDNYWVLPDPGCHMSAHHCKIEFRDQAFWVRDTSRNGVFINGSMRPLGFGSKVRVSDGDVITFATYRVRVRLRIRGASAPAVSVVEGESPPSPLVAPEETVAAAGQAPKLEAPSQTHDAPASQNPEPSPVVEVSVKPVEALESPQPAPAIEATGEHEQMHTEHDESTGDDVVEPTPLREPAAEPATAEAEEQPAELLATRVLDPAIITAELPCVLHIDRARLQADGHLPPESVERLIANQFRHIKRPLIKNAFGKGVVEAVPNGRLVMVTSSLPEEGKTFSSINLAFSLAREKDLEVVLIDADVAKQHLSRIFGIADAPGLLNALVDDSIDVESLILPTNVKGLSLLPAGQHVTEDVATELLASSRMEEIADRIGARRPHRIALFDSPPLLLTNESRVLASLMGQILLVVRAGVTPQQAVLESIGYVDEDKPLGLVLNRAKSHAPGSYYGYGSYGYGSYGAGEAENKPSAKQPDAEKA